MAAEQKNLLFCGQLLEKGQGLLEPFIVKGGQGIVQQDGGPFGQTELTDGQPYGKIELIHRSPGQGEGAVGQYIPCTDGGSLQFPAEGDG